LKSFEIQLIADIRSLPGSRLFPQFNKESLELNLPQNGIRYLHIPGLGGRRKKKKDSRNTGWRLDSFRNYADYMETDEFREAIASLKELATAETTAIMCAEALWWRCHRSLVSDYLVFNGWKVIHITGKGKSMEHTYTKPARIIEGKLSYEAEINNR
jgi:uncharacterized protein (DUF488 family)